MAGQLTQVAETQRLSLQDFSVRLLREGLNGSEDAPGDWRALNARRLHLIARKYAEGLSKAEEAELQRLQQASEEASAPMDRKLLARLQEW